MKKIFLILSIAISFVINAQAKNGGTTDGAFTTLMLSTTDVERYVETLKSNTAAFKATGATDAGVCITRSGNEYDGQMMVWSAFPSIQAALEGSLKYDPQKAPHSFARLRDAKYGVTWKPLKPFRLDPGYERVQRVVISGNKLQEFITAMTAFEEAVIDAGNDFFVGVFVPLGGGTHEAKTLMVRAITPDAASHGKIFDDYFDGNAPWASEWAALQAVGYEVISDNFEECEQTYSAN
jgi:hypothetical protein|tara:strand:- start:294 stop:1004 length:711 start_codon:yes stop_codon:yes gene_type:complete